MPIEANQNVSINYELKIDGQVVDTNQGKEPLKFTLGVGQIIPGLEKEIAKMSIGEEAQIRVVAAEAYGEYNEEAMQTLPKEQFVGVELEVGMPLQGQGEGGNPIQVVVKEILEDSVVIDFNHPLAGKDLDFTVSIVSID